MTMDLPLSLTMEQQFALKTYTEGFRQMSPEQKEEAFLSIVTQLMVHKNLVKHFMAATV